MTGEEHGRRWVQACRDGGRLPDDRARVELVDAAREVLAKRNAARFRDRPPTSAPASASWEPTGARLLPVPPGSMVVRASDVLGFDGEVHRLSFELERTAQHRDQLIALVRAAPSPPGPGEIDLHQLEQALDTGRGLPRDAERQLLEVVRELIGWRKAAGRPA